MADIFISVENYGIYLSAELCILKSNFRQAFLKSIFLIVIYIYTYIYIYREKYLTNLIYFVHKSLKLNLYIYIYDMISRVNSSRDVKQYNVTHHDVTRIFPYSVDYLLITQIIY